VLQASARAETRAIAAKGLTGPGYDGHAFWDTESFVLPILTYSAPELARAALAWRHSTLDLARERARQLGLRGAALPWRTIHGEECSGYWPAGTAAFHVNADVADAVRRYVLATGDEDFEREIGVELLVETARLWASLGQFDAQRRFRIDGVTGPDEYSALVDDNVYRKQVVKQADLVLALYARGDAFTAEQKRRDFDHYEQLTVRDSSPSACVQAIVAAEVGHLDLAYDYLAEAALMDLDDLEHNVIDGVHIASLGGAVLAVIAGFGGARDYGGALAFAPRLPAGLTRLAFPAIFRGRRLQVEVTPQDATYSLREGALQISHWASASTWSPAPRPGARFRRRHACPRPPNPPAARPRAARRRPPLRLGPPTPLRGRRREVPALLRSAAGLGVALAPRTGRLTAHDRHVPVRLEDDQVDVRELAEAAFECGRAHLVLGDGLRSQRSLEHAAVLEQHPRRALEDPARAAAPEHHAHERVIGEEQRRRPDDPADERVVGADHRVLQRVRGQEQHGEVQHVDLPELALAAEPQRGDEEGEDEQRAEDLLEQRHLRDEKVLQQRRGEELDHTRPFGERAPIPTAPRHAGWRPSGPPCPLRTGRGRRPGRAACRSRWLGGGERRPAIHRRQCRESPGTWLASRTTASAGSRSTARNTRAI